MATRKNIHDYSNIIDMPRPDLSHPRMSMKDRAAQFAPFAALTGHKEAIGEKNRITEPKRILDHHQKELLDQTLNRIIENIKQSPQIKVLYFEKDLKKEGGAYISYIGQVKKIDEYHKTLVFKSGKVIYLNDIYTITFE